MPIAATSICQVSALFAELVRSRVLTLTAALAPVQLKPNVTSPVQAQFVCSLLARMQEAIGIPALRMDLFAPPSPDDVVSESDLDEDWNWGIFPIGGHPSNVRYTRELFQESGLGWLCEHEAFSASNVLS